MLSKIYKRQTTIKQLLSHATYVATISRSNSSSYVASQDKLLTNYDAIIVGAGHNGLVAAAYLQKNGLKVCVLERRHLIGGAAVTEELIPGFKFSRASYLLSLLRPQVMDELELKKHGLKLYFREPNSYTPLHESYWREGKPRSLTMGNDKEFTSQQIGRFSEKDAVAFFEYEHTLNAIIDVMGPVLDTEPVDIKTWETKGLAALKIIRDNWQAVKTITQSSLKLGKYTIPFYELMTAPASKILNRWFESEPLKAALATDSVIGAMLSPHSPGSGYVLLHHVMGELDGRKGAWAYVEGGMGAVSAAIAKSAVSHGVHIFTEMPVSEVLVDNSNQACGVVLNNGKEVRARLVLSNATPKVTFLDLIDKKNLPNDFLKDVQSIDFASPTTKINVAVKQLPNFLADPNSSPSTPMPHHRCTIHINTETTEMVHDGYVDALNGNWSKKPLIEMTIPSALDPTLAPPGCHVVQLFTQYTPYSLSNGRKWDQQTTNEYADHVFDSIESYAPGFKASVIGRDVLPPPEIERIFGLTGGNIFHGALSLDQLYSFRPLPSISRFRTPIQGLYLCGSGAHPGGGVTGGPGRLAALRVLADLKKK